MATGIEKNYLNLTCDVCNSNDIIETVQGYVCRACGIELTVERLQYDRPYTQDLVQYEKGLGKTQIGNRKERLRLPNSRSLERLSWHNTTMGNEESVILRAQKEISRIFEILDLPRNKKALVIDRFSHVRSHLKPRSRIRNPEKLSAILVYMSLRVQNIAISRSELIDNSELTNGEFNRFFMQVRAYLPEYSGRDRITSVSQKLMEITEHFGLGMPFYFLSKKILHRLWNAVNNTTDSVIAGLCASITALIKYKGVINVSSVCKLLEIKMSAVQFQVQVRVFKAFKIEGFTTLVRSSELLTKFMRRLGLIEGEGSDDNEAVEVESLPEVVQIELGNAPQIFNPLNEHYIFEFLDEFGASVCAYLEVLNHENGLEFKTVETKENEALGVVCNLTLGHYFPIKGPPSVVCT